MDDVAELVLAIARIGRENPGAPQIDRIEPFSHFFDSDGRLDKENLNRRDGGCTRREVILRFLVLSAVLDQGPDIVGLRMLLWNVTNELYRNEVRFLHQPATFFKELGIAIDRILEEHDSVKNLRAEEWARDNQSKANRYNLFLDQSKQVLNYAIFRWGVPLALPLLLDRDETDEDRKPTVLTSYLKSWVSSEQMSRQLKGDPRYGLGKAIGDKACHLFAKWSVSSFGLLNDSTEKWGNLSYESPFDSNAGRVLWRAGFLQRWVPEQEYRAKEVIQADKGKGGLNYIRVTNIRGMKTSNEPSDEIEIAYREICCEHLCSHKRAPQSFEIQRLPNAYLLAYGDGLGMNDFDDGLIYVGTGFCFNHDEPLCSKCPIRNVCAAAKGAANLIEEYRT